MPILYVHGVNTRSFNARDIFLGVDDGSYDSGMSPLAAHREYLKRPTSHRKFAEKLRNMAGERNDGEARGKQCRALTGA